MAVLSAWGKDIWAALTLIRNKVFFLQGSEEISSLELKDVPIFGGNEILFLTPDNRLRTKFP